MPPNRLRRPVTLTLSAEARAALERLAKEWRQDMSRVVERLLLADSAEQMTIVAALCVVEATRGFLRVRKMSLAAHDAAVREMRAAVDAFDEFRSAEGG